MIERDTLQQRGLVSSDCWLLHPSVHPTLDARRSVVQNCPAIFKNGLRGKESAASQGPQPLQQRDRTLEAGSVRGLSDAK